MSTPTDTPDVDAIAAAVVTAALWADGVPLGMGEDGETGGLQHLSVPDEDRAIVAGYVRAFLAAADPADIAAFAEDTEHSRGGDDVWGELGQTLYLDATGHGAGFWDGRMRTAAGDRLHGVARRTCRALEHATFAQEDESTASISLTPAVETLTVVNVWTDHTPIPETRETEYRPVEDPAEAPYSPMRGDIVTVPGDGYAVPGGRTYVVTSHICTPAIGGHPPRRVLRPGEVRLRPCSPTGDLEGEAGNIVTTHAGQVRPWQSEGAST